MDADDLQEAVDDDDVKINGFDEELSDISDDDLQLAQLHMFCDTSAYTPTPDVAIHLRGCHDIPGCTLQPDACPALLTLDLVVY